MQSNTTVQCLDGKQYRIKTKTTLNDYLYRNRNRLIKVSCLCCAKNITAANLNHVITKHKKRMSHV